MALIVTPGADDANSFATLVEANDYNSSRTFAAIWGSTDTTNQEAAMKQAARLMCSSFHWTGKAVDEDQALAWPREGMLSRNGFVIPISGTKSIPRDLKESQSEFARQLIEADRTADNEAQKAGITSVKAGPVTIGFTDREAGDRDRIDAGIRRLGPDFDYIWLAIPDAVRNLLPPSWYERKTLTSLLFEANS